MGKPWENDGLLGFNGMIALWANIAGDDGILVSSIFLGCPEMETSMTGWFCWCLVHGES